MKIAKYRMHDPNGWFVSEFTMDQIEKYITILEADNAKLRTALKETALHAHNQARRADDTLDELKETVSELDRLRKEFK